MGGYWNYGMKNMLAYQGQAIFLGWLLKRVIAMGVFDDVSSHFEEGGY